jgi:hypothetical protein
MVFNAHWIIIFSLPLFLQDGSYNLRGNWSLRSYDAIDKVRASPGYLFGDDKDRQALEKQFEEVLTKGAYIFSADTLHYTDLEGGAIIYRDALWHVKGQVLYIDEINRPYHRQAFIHFVTNDSLVISPIIEGIASTSKMKFVRKMPE